ncbi:MAG: response regulator [Candidatus Omnitrophica bacterium]|nr:response regulator [Candidatus Omnitrophota bacterium]
MSSKPKVLVVDDEEWNRKILESHLVSQGIEVFSAAGGKEALDKISEQEFDLVLLDIMMPGIDGFEVCREIKKQRHLQTTPVVMVTALQETADKVKGLDAGASDFLSKPIDKAELTARVRAHLRIKSLMNEVEAWNQTLEQRVAERILQIREKSRQLDESYYLTLEALIMALDVREHETGKHSLRVAFYTTELAKAGGVKGKDLEEIAMGSLLHDIGKIGISDQILLKPGKLTTDEWVEMKKHPGIGWNIVKDIEFVGHGRDLILAHQERYSGNGYPKGLKGKEICTGARFFAVADVFDALMSERPYKPAFSFDDTRKMIEQASGIDLDPDIVAIFMSMTREHWSEIDAAVEKCTFKELIRRIRNGDGLL